MRYDNQNLAHAWAYDTYDDRCLQSYNGNFWSRGDSCYSYSTKIARKLVDKQVLLLDHYDYSSTTQRHKLYLERAFSHWTVIEVQHRNLDYPEREGKHLQEVITSYMSVSEKNKVGVLKYKDDRELFQDHVHNLGLLVDYEIVESTPQLVEFLEKAEAFAAKCYKFDEDRTKEREERKRKKIDEAYKKMEEAMTEHSWKGFVEVAKEASRGLFRFVDTAEFASRFFKITERPATEYGWSWSYIWRDGDDVKTSKGVTVSWKDVEVLLKLWKAGKPIVGKVIGPYTVLTAIPQLVRVGCHTIPAANLEALYNEEINCKGEC